MKLLLALLLAPALRAEPPIVVKADGGEVYLDVGSGAAAPGQPFELYEEGEELKHPVTGESLGRLEKALFKGTLVSVHEKYSVGRLESGAARVGLKARLGASPAAAPAAAEVPASEGPVLPFRLDALGLADLDGDGAEELVAGGDGRAALLSKDGTADEPLPLESGATLVHMGGADLDGDGREELFATGFTAFDPVPRSWVLRLKEGRLELAGRLTGMVRVLGPLGARQAYHQSVRPGEDVPYGPVTRLAHAGGDWKGGEAVEGLGRGVWLYGWLRGAELFLFDRARHLAAAEESWISERRYARTPRRLRLGRRMELFPPGRADGEVLRLVHNVPGRGLMADKLGSYSRMELCKVERAGRIFREACLPAVDGYAADLAVGADALFVGVVTKKESRVYTYPRY